MKSKVITEAIQCRRKNEQIRQNKGINARHDVTGINKEIIVCFHPDFIFKRPSKRAPIMPLVASMKLHDQGVVLYRCRGYSSVAPALPVDAHVPMFVSVRSALFFPAAEIDRDKRSSIIFADAVVVFSFMIETWRVREQSLRNTIVRRCRSVAKCSTEALART